MKLLPQTQKLQKQVKIPITITFKPFLNNLNVQHFNKQPSRCSRCQSYVNCYTQINENKYICSFCGKTNYLDDIAPELNIQWQSNITEYEVEGEQYNPANTIQMTGEIQNPCIKGISEDEQLLLQQEFKSQGQLINKNYAIYLVQLSPKLMSSNILEQILYFQIFASINTIFIFVTNHSQIIIDNENSIHELDEQCPIDMPLKYYICDQLSQEDKQSLYSERSQIIREYYQEVCQQQIPGFDQMIKQTLNAIQSLSTCGGQVNLILFETILSNTQKSFSQQDIQLQTELKARLASYTSINKHVQTCIFYYDNIDTQNNNIQLTSLIQFPIFSQGKIIKLNQSIYQQLLQHQSQLRGFNASQTVRTSLFLEVVDEQIESPFNMGCLTTDSLSDWQLEVVETLPEINYIQYAVLYTNLKGQRVIRVITQQLRATNKISIIYNFLEEYQLASSELRRLIKQIFQVQIQNGLQVAGKQISNLMQNVIQTDQNKKQEQQNNQVSQNKQKATSQQNIQKAILEGIKDTPDQFLDTIVGWLVNFRNLSQGTTQRKFLLPYTLQLLPLLYLCVQRFPAFSRNLQRNEGGQISVFKKASCLCQCLYLNNFEFAREIYPGCFRFKEILQSQEEELITFPYPLNSMFLQEMSKNCYWFINRKESVVMVGREDFDTISQIFQLFGQKLNEQYMQNQQLLIQNPPVLYIQWTKEQLQNQSIKIIYNIFQLYQNTSNSITFAVQNSVPFDNLHALILEDANSQYESYYDTMQFVQKNVQARKK